MRSDRLVQALGNIDDRLVLDVIPGTFVKKKSFWPVAMAMAAVLTLCIFGIEKLSLLQTEPQEVLLQQSAWEDAFAASVDVGLDPEVKQRFLDYVLSADHLDAVDPKDCKLWFMEDAPEWNTSEPTLFLIQTTETTIVSRTMVYENDAVYEEETREYSIEKIQEKIMSATDYSGIGEEIKLEFLEYIVENFDPVFPQLLGWDWYFEETDSYQSMLLPHLLIVGPVDDGIQINDFVYYENAVQFAGRYVENVNASSYYEPEFSDTFWRDFNDVFTRDQYFPGAEQAGAEARNAMMVFFEEDPSRIAAYVGGDWSWSRQSVLGIDYAVLSCEAPILSEVGVRQCFLYNYEWGSVSYGPSGAHGGDDGNDVVQMIRNDLKNWDLDSSVANLRDCLAHYYYQNAQEISDLLENERPAMGATHPEEQVYYRLQNVEKQTDEIFVLCFEGMSVPDDRSLSGRSNYTTLEWNYPWKHYQNRDQEAIVRAMASDKPYENQGLEVCDQLTVTVRLTNGDKPFEYLDFWLENLSGNTLPLKMKFCNELPERFYHYVDAVGEHTIQILFTTTEPLYQLSFLEMQYVEDHYQAEEILYQLEAMNPDESLIVDLILTGGVVEHRGIAYTDSEGVEHQYVIRLSGKTGNIELLEVS